MPDKIRVWDLPTRIFHWSLAVALAGLVTTASIGGNAMPWHFRCGYLVLSLLLFRLCWGLVGGHWSRFASFAYSPKTALLYLKGQGSPEQSIGHNPAGSFSVFAMLGFLLLQVGTGLFSDDEIAAAGPGAKFVSNSWVSLATQYHAEVGKIIVLGLVALHIGAILFYRFKRGENLVSAMILGDKESSYVLKSSRDDRASRWLAVGLFVACASLVAWLVSLA